MATKTIEICDACNLTTERVVTPWSTFPTASPMTCSVPSAFDSTENSQRGGLRLGVSTFDLCPACATKAAAALGLDFQAKAKQQHEENQTAYVTGFQATMQAMGFPKDGVARAASVSLVGGALSDKDLAELGLLTPEPKP